MAAFEKLKTASKNVVKAMVITVRNFLSEVFKQLRSFQWKQAYKPAVQCWWLRHDEQTGILHIHNARKYGILNLKLKVTCKAGNQHTLDIPKLRGYEVFELKLFELQNWDKQYSQLKRAELVFGSNTYCFENIEGRLIARRCLKAG